MYYAYSHIMYAQITTLTSYDLSCRFYSLDMHVIFYSCLPGVAQSNGATLSVTGEDYIDAIAPEITEIREETPQQLAEWAREDVFQTFMH